MMFRSAASALLLSSSLAIAQVEPPIMANTVPVEYEHAGDALLGHLSVPTDGEGPFPGA
jgi:hypothetical protein